MSFEQVVEEVLSWPAERQAALRERLDEALGGDDDDGISREELHSRIDEALSDDAELIPHKQVMLEARNRRNSA